MAKIKLTQNKYAIVDDEDYDFLNQWKWCALKQQDGKFYAVRTAIVKNRNNESTPKRIAMHRLVNNTPDKLYTDHINGDTLDNRKCNLRSCTNSENQFNRGKSSNNSSGFRGVDRAYGKFRATIQIDGNRLYLGSYNTASEAGLAYQKAALKYHNQYYTPK